MGGSTVTAGSMVGTATPTIAWRSSTRRPGVTVAGSSTWLWGMVGQTQSHRRSDLREIRGVIARFDR